MSTFLSLTPAQKIQLASLPYKAALFISHADDVDGAHDDINEKKAMFFSLKALSQHHKESEVIVGAVSTILESKALWAEWEHDAFRVLSEAPVTMKSVFDHFGKAEAKLYRVMILELAEAVAGAHAEFAAFEDENEGAGFLSGLINKIVGKFSELEAGSAEGAANISAAEDAALAELAEALKIPE
jgi:hypothetical protein